MRNFEIIILSVTTIVLSLVIVFFNKINATQRLYWMMELN